MAPPDSIAGVILAGGRATRMGGGDKPLLDLAGRSMLGHVVARLSPQVARLALNANGDPSRFAAFNLCVLADTVPNHPGPLAGVLAGMDWAAALGFSCVITVAGDTPFLPHDLAARLSVGPFTIAASPDAEGTLRQHPTVGLWPTALRDDLRAALMQGERKVGRWAMENGAQNVEFHERPDPFFNVNTPEDLRQATARL